MTGAAVWRVWGRNLPARCVVARSFDEAIKKAREFDAGYCAGQIVVEDLDQPDFVSGAPNYAKFKGWTPEEVLSWLNID